MTRLDPSRAIKLVGTEAPDTPGKVLTAGPLSVEFDNGVLRYARFNGIEVLRMVAFLVRDENWGTFSAEIQDLTIDQRSGRFEVSYRARCGDMSRSLVYDARIVGEASGELRFDAIATAETDFLTNRTGFVVLHPLKGCTGQRVEILHVDGRRVVDKFPEIINPVQPFYDIRALTHEVLPGLSATCLMEGDTFEMEDHRNWTDASYKTYVRPLALPWPYTIPAGSRFEQSVSLTFSGGAPHGQATARTQGLTVELGAATDTTMPMIGLGVPAEEARHAITAAKLVKEVGPQLLVCQLDLRKGHGQRELELYRQLGEATGADVVLEIVLPGEGEPRDELLPAAEAAAAAGLAPAAIAVSPAVDLKAVLPGSAGPKVPPPERIYAAAREAFPGVPLGGGMFSYFTELNRKRPPARMLDYITHTTCPIVHAADDRSVMETLEALPYVIQSTRAFSDGRPYRVGPSAIGARDNPYGAATAPNPDNGRVCLAKMDPRQRGLFAAAWTLGYVAAFARGGVEAITLGAPVGPFGLIYRRTDYAQPYYDDLVTSAVYPLFHVTSGLARAAGAALLEAASSDPSCMECLGYRRGGQTVLWLANLTATEQTVSLAGRPSGPARLRMLDEGSFVQATTDPLGFAAATQPLDEPSSLRLGAYAVACLDLGRA